MNIVVPIVGPDLKTAEKDIKKAGEMRVPLVEIRYDLIENPDLEKLLLPYWTRSVFTNMRESEGGKYKGPDEEWRNILEKALEYRPRYVSVGRDYYHLINSMSIDTEIIASYHNFKETPDNLEKIYYELKNLTPKPNLVKLATRANSYEDALRMLNLIHKANMEQQRIIGLSMGQHGIWIRVLGPKFGSELTFAALDKSKVSAPGQPTFDELIELEKLLQF